MKIEEIVGQRVREVRELNDLTQEQVGRALGPLLGREWSRQAVSAAESGGRAFTAVELVALAHVLGISVGRLVTPPVAVRAVDMPGGQAIERTAIVNAALSKASPEKALDGLAEQLRLLATAAVQVNENAGVVLQAIEGMYQGLEAAVEAAAVRGSEDRGA